MRTVLVVVCVIAVGGLVAGSASGQQYTARLLEVPEGWQGMVRGMNNPGMTVGRVYKVYPDHEDWSAAFWDSQGRIRLLPPVGFQQSDAYSVNDCGQVVVRGAAGRDTPYTIWTESAGFEAIPVSGGAINNLGKVAGHLNAPDGNSSWAVVWNPGGTVTQIGNVPGQRHTTASGLNDAGTVVGSGWNDSVGHPYVWTQSTGIVDLSAPWPLGAWTGQVNEAGEIAGTRQVAQFQYLALTWDAQGNVRELELLADQTTSEAYDINDAGWVAGMANAPSTLQTVPVIWSPSGWQMKLPLPAGYLYGSATAINDNGWIAGDVYYPGKDGFMHAPVVWVPVAEPSSLLVLASGAVGLAGVAVRRRG